jgi:hypothetical protein
LVWHSVAPEPMLVQVGPVGAAAACGATATVTAVKQAARNVAAEPRLIVMVALLS